MAINFQTENYNKGGILRIRLTLFFLPVLFFNKYMLPPYSKVTTFNIPNVLRIQFQKAKSRLFRKKQYHCPAVTYEKKEINGSKNVAIMLYTDDYVSYRAPKHNNFISLG